MNNGNYIWLLIAFHSFFPLISAAQPVGEATFKDVVSRFEEHRAQLLSYAAQIEVVEYSESKFDEYVHRTVNLRRFDVLADVTRDSYLIIRNKYSVLPQYNQNDDSKIFLKNGPRVFIGQGGTLLEKRAFSDWDGFFDPQVIGLGFCAELGRFFEFEQVLSNYRNWQKSEWWKMDRADGVLTFGTKAANGTYSERYSFSEKQGYSPVWLEMSNVGLKVQCSYIELDGIWLPKVCRYQCNKSGGLVASIDWIAVNKPLARDLFEEATVRKMLGSVSEQE